MADKLIKKLNGYIIRDEEAYNKAQSIIDGKDANNKEVKAAKAKIADTSETITVNPAGTDTQNISWMLPLVAGTGADMPIYAGSGMTIKNNGASLSVTDISATTFTEGGKTLSDKYATKDSIKVKDVYVNGKSAVNSNGIFVLNVDKTTEDNSADSLSVPSTRYVDSLLQGHTSAFVFNTRSAMLDDLKNAGKTAYPIGSQLLIAEKNVPDYWVAKNTGTVGTSYSAITSPQNGYTVGCYTIYELETEKVDLTGYATETYVNDKISAVETNTSNNYIKKGAAATVSRVTGVEAAGVDQRIYLINSGTYKKIPEITLVGNDAAGYSGNATYNIPTKLTNVSVTAANNGSDTDVVVSHTYDSSTGVLEVRCTSLKGGLVQLTITGESTIANVGAIYKDGYAYLKLYSSSEDAQKNPMLTETYDETEGKLTLSVTYA